MGCGCGFYVVVVVVVVWWIFVVRSVESLGLVVFVFVLWCFSSLRLVCVWWVCGVGGC